MQMVVPALMLTLTNNVDADSSGRMNWNRPLGPQASGKDMDKDTDSQASSALPWISLGAKAGVKFGVCVFSIGLLLVGFRLTASCVCVCVCFGLRSSVQMHMLPGAWW